MTTYKNSKMETIYKHSEEADYDDCEVIINDNEIVISYEESDGIVVYQGANKGDGHFRLASNYEGRGATLHMFEGDIELVGTWFENGQLGVWIIVLGEPLKANFLPVVGM